MRVPCLCECLHLPWGFFCVRVFFGRRGTRLWNWKRWKVSPRKSAKRKLQAGDTQREWNSAQISSRLICKLCNEGVYCIYLASAMRCRSDRHAGRAKQQAHTGVTLSGPTVICNNNSLCIPVDPWQTDTMVLHATCFCPLTSLRPEVPLRGTQKTSEIQHRCSSTLTETSLVDYRESAENELLSSVCAVCWYWRRFRLTQSKNKAAQRHFSVCSSVAPDMKHGRLNTAKWTAFFIFYNPQHDFRATAVLWIMNNAHINAGIIRDGAYSADPSFHMFFKVLIQAKMCIVTRVFGPRGAQRRVKSLSSRSSAAPRGKFVFAHVKPEFETCA